MTPVPLQQVESLTPHERINAPVDDRPVDEAPCPMICHCHQITEVAVRRIIDGFDATSVHEVALHTGAGSSCRGCRRRLGRLLAGLPPSCSRFAPCDRCGYAAAVCGCSPA